MKLFYFVSITLIFTFSGRAERAEFNGEHCRRVINTIPHVPEQFKLRACDSLEKNVGTEFNVFSMPADENGCSRTIVLIGENHKSEPVRRNETYQLARHFPVRLHEDAWDTHLLENSGRTSDIASENSNNGNASLEEALRLQNAEDSRQFWQSKIEVPRGSPMNDLISDGGLRLFYDENEFRYGFRMDQDSSAAELLTTLGTLDQFNSAGDEQCSYFELSDFDSTTMSPPEFLRIYASQIGRPDFPAIDITMENGRLNHYNYDCEEFNSLTCMMYIQTARNHRMIENIIRASDALPCNIPTMAIVGRAHLHPLTRLMTIHGREGRQFSDELSGYSYDTTTGDPEFGSN